MFDNYTVETKIKIKLIQTRQADTDALDLHIAVYVLHQRFQGTFN